MRALPRFETVCLTLLGTACVPAPIAQPAAPSSVVSATPTAVPVQSVIKTGEPQVAVKTSAPELAPQPCGALDCLAFATPQAAFDFVLATQPRILALGEAHAQEGTSGIASSTHRFAEQLLPRLAGKSKHLVVELLLANCKQQTVQAVAKDQAPVTEHQAKSNQNEFVLLGKYAQRLGIEPQALTPECAEYEAVVASGADSVPRLLSLVAQQTRKEIEALLAAAPDSDEIILSYGGALHNDLYPRPGQEAWSFGPKLAQDSHGRYVELDLIVPEYVKDSDAWRNLPWFSAFDRAHLRSETLLYRPAPSSFVLIFPKTERTPPAPL